MLLCGIMRGIDRQVVRGVAAGGSAWGLCALTGGELPAQAAGGPVQARLLPGVLSGAAC